MFSEYPSVKKTQLIGEGCSRGLAKVTRIVALSVYCKLTVVKCFLPIFSSSSPAMLQWNLGYLIAIFVAYCVISQHGLTYFRLESPFDDMKIIERYIDMKNLTFEIIVFALFEGLAFYKF